MKITKNFTLEELTRSQTATRKGIDNTPNNEEVSNLIDLTSEVLQKVRDGLNTAVFVNSGFRSTELNKAIGGVDRIDSNTGKRIVSQHVKGQAADIVASGYSSAEVFNYIADNLEFDQLIYEFGRWVHVSFNKGSNRMQKLEAYKDAGNITRYKSIERAA